MPSHMKTYQRKSKSTKSVEAVNALFAENLTKRLKSRRKARVELKELPPRTGAYLTDDSLTVEVETNTTFDRLRNGKVYNYVKMCNLVKIASSHSSQSVSFHSPIMTRSRKKTTVSIEEIPNKTVSKEETLDRPVTISLSIEKETDKLNFSSLSYIKLPKVAKKHTSGHSDAPFFSDTFRERHLVHSSTPYVAAPCQKIVADPISPITKSDSSNSSKLIEKSYDQIRQWDEEFPILDNSNETPKKGKRSMKGKRKSSENDWKLSTKPQVYLERLDSDDEEEHESFAGWKEEEQKTASRELEKMRLGLSLSGLEPICFNKLKNDRSRNESTKGVINRKSHDGSTKNSQKESIKGVPTKTKNTRSTVSPKTKRVTLIRDSPRTSQRVTRGTNPIVLLTPPKKRSTRGVSRSPRVQKLTPRESKNYRRSSKEKTKVTQEVTKVTRKFPAITVRHSPLSAKLGKNRRTSAKLGKNRRTSGKATRRTSEKATPVVTRQTSGKVTRRSSGKVTPVMTRRAARMRNRVDATSGDRQRSSSSKKKKVDDRNFVTRRRRRQTKSFLVDVTDDILSEKEMSYSRSDLSEKSSKINYSTDELQREREVNIPIRKEESTNLTVDLAEFESFVIEHSYYDDEDRDVTPKDVPVKNNVENVKKVQVDAVMPTSSNLKATKDSSPVLNQSNRTFISSTPQQNKSHQSVVTPKTPKIIIISDITLGPSLPDIQHDHTYSSPLPSSSMTKSHHQLSDIIESSLQQADDDHACLPREPPPPPFRKPKPKSINLKAGKSYRRSLSLLRRSSILVDVKAPLCSEDCVCSRCIFKEKVPERSRRSSMIVPARKTSLNASLLEEYARSSCYVQEEDRRQQVERRLDESIGRLSINVNRQEKKSQVIHDGSPLLQQVTARDLVLRRCGQTDVVPFEECYPPSALQNCHKIGEGVYGEVFLYKKPDGGTSVMKIIPIEGDLTVNGERQKKFNEILSEIVIAMELSNLRTNRKNATGAYSEVQKIRCTKGNYPDRLLDLWDLYDETKGSENESPQMFPSDQMYIVLELANGGKDLESYIFDNAKQAYAMFKQTASALAVAETELKFEHRDLHWGNVLINCVDKSKTLYYRLEGKEIEVETFGVEVTVIDFTLSRIEFDGVVIFNDLSLDNELFVAKGDYQFEIYRLMQKSNRNEWQHFEPYTNVLWLHYLLDKASQLRFKNARTKVHKEYLAKLMKIKEMVLSYNSAADFVKNNFM